MDTEWPLGATLNVKTWNTNDRFRNFISDAYFSVGFSTNCVFWMNVSLHESMYYSTLKGSFQSVLFLGVVEETDVALSV